MLREPQPPKIGKLAGLAERQQVIAATPRWKRGRMAMKLLGPGSDR